MSTLERAQCRTKEDLIEIFRKLESIRQQKGQVQVAGTSGNLKAEVVSLRNLEQNDMKERQVHEIAKQLYGGDEQATRLEIKLNVAAPILCREDQKFRAFFNAVVKPFDYPRQLKCMEWIPVTSIMTTKQMSETIEKTFDYYAQQGVTWDMQ